MRRCRAIFSNVGHRRLASLVMGQEPIILNMNPATSGRSNTRASGYHQKALAEIRNSLLPFANGGGASSNDNYSSAASTISTISTTSGVSSASGLSSNSNGLDNKDLNALRQTLTQIISMGYTEESALRALKQSNGTYEAAVNYLKQQPSPVEMCNGLGKSSGAGGVCLGTKLMRKSSLEREISVHRSSPAATMDSGAGSSRSDSPRQLNDILGHQLVSRQYSPSNFSEPPPPPPPRNSSTPPPPPPPHAYPNVPSNMQQMLKRMSPAPVVPSRPPAPTPTGPCSTPNHQRGNSPVSAVAGRQPMIIQNGPQVQQQLTQQIQALSLYQNAPGGGVVDPPPPPYPIVASTGGVASPPPPSYAISIQNRQSPTQSQTGGDYRKSPSSGIYSGSASAGSPSPTSNVSSLVGSTGSVPAASVTRAAPLPGWSARQAKTQPPIIMQSVKSTQVQKPVLQTAIAPTAPSSATAATAAAAAAAAAAAVAVSSQPPPPPPSYASSIQQKQQQSSPQCQKAVSSSPCPPPQQASLSTASPTVPTTEPPSYASTMLQRAVNLPPYSSGAAAKDEALNNNLVNHTNHVNSSSATNNNNNCTSPNNHNCNTPTDQLVAPRATSAVHPMLQRKFSPSESRSESPASASSAESRTPPLPPSASSSANCVQNGIDKKPYKIDHQSPIPERKHMSKEKEEERRDCKVRIYSPQAFKFYMEQHIENVHKSYKQRLFRRVQLETEMAKIGLSAEAQCQMRKMLYQKESNYIRLKRAKMDKSVFTKIKPIGVGAFGEVTLVRKIDTNHLYAMKTLRKADVLKRNQVAHVKAERDILAEADNEWVVKLYYSFQDKDNLYFVMDYIPGGDLMSLLIKFGIFDEQLARFYLAELTCAVESVHKMGFIHRDIKPDNILIDRDGHIKLTDFGLCTGFRWTHNSKYYQNNGEHNRQDSLEPTEEWINSADCKCYPTKPLERRRKREQHQRCLAHSLVGTPNYIAPEVLLRTGYSQLCDWWSVGVILYEMLIGQPPFLANSPAETQLKVINWETTLKIPPQPKISRESIDLILKLCTSSDRRLGKNANEVKEHPFFASINFKEGVRRLTPPYTPKIQYSTDTSNFDPIDPDKLRNSTANESERPDELTGGGPFHGFFEFTFRRFFDDGGAVPFPSRINLDENDNQGAVYV